MTVRERRMMRVNKRSEEAPIGQTTSFRRYRRRNVRRVMPDLAFTCYSLPVTSVAPSPSSTRVCIQETSSETL